MIVLVKAKKEVSGYFDDSNPVALPYSRASIFRSHASETYHLGLFLLYKESLKLLALAEIVLATVPDAPPAVKKIRATS